MIIIFYILVKKDQNKTDLEKKKTEKLNAKVEAIEKSLENHLIQNNLQRDPI